MTQLTGQTDRRLWLTRPAHAAALSDYVQLAKPRLTLMVVITAFIGFAMGLRHVEPGQWSWLALLATLIGTALCCIGAGVFNQIIERRTDALMPRTMDRPLPAGRMQPAHALIVAVAACAAGLAMLLVMTNLVCTSFAALTIIGYVLVYTPMKRINSASTIVGAFPGALPPVIGYTAVTGAWGPEAFVLFAILFLWQLPHFLAICWLYRDDYTRAGLPMLPVVDPTGASTFRQIMIACMALVPLGLLPTLLGISGPIYLGVALIAGTAFLIFGVALVTAPTRRRARMLFLASLVYLPVIFTTMLIDKT